MIKNMIKIWKLCFLLGLGCCSICWIMIWSMVITLPHVEISENNTFQHINMFGYSSNESNWLSATNETMDLFSVTTDTELNRFISDNIQPTTEYLDRCTETVNKLIRFLQNNVPDKVRPSKVIKSGSLGKGTIVMGKSDIDLTLLLARYTQVRDMVRAIEELLTILEHHLRGFQVVTRANKNRFCVQIEVRCHGGHTSSVDIVPAVNVLDKEPSRDRIYEKLGEVDRDLLQYYSASFVPLMIDFFSRLPTKLKTLIRLVKYWNGQVRAPDKSVRWPMSFGFEMVSIFAWMRAGEPTYFNMARALHAVLTCLVHHRDFRVDFGARTYYSRRFLSPPQSGPYIMDPVDPYDNVYTRNHWDWDRSAVKAREWLRRPLFLGLDDGSTATQW